MPSRNEIVSIYEVGPDALVAWVEQLLAAHATRLAQLLANQARLEQQVRLLTGRLTELEARLKKASQTATSRPPAMDRPPALLRGQERPHPRSLSQWSGKKRGGQAGIRA